MTKLITVTIDAAGNATVEADGFSGPACEKATAEILRALGGEQEETRKPDWYRRQEQQQSAAGG